MQYAINEHGERIKASPGLHAVCPSCRSPVISKCGDIKIHHFAHESIKDCDSWHENETLWHRQWKEMVPESWREIVINKYVANYDICQGFVSQNGITLVSHRADIQNPRTGLVVELQHSPLTIQEIKERENFYNNMIWVFDAREFKLRRRRKGDIEIGGKLTECYIWKRARKWIINGVTKPMFFDMGLYVIYVKMITNHYECRLHTMWMDFNTFRSLYLE